MAAGSTLVASKHSIAAPFFLVKSTIAYFSKAYSARFYTDGVRLFVLPDKQYKFFSHRIYRLVNQKKQEVNYIARKRDPGKAYSISGNLL